ncbi:hypothetical protein [Paracoccus sp. ME4]|uniref:hypothetical protein n=1 Tax=Paracoccus sp. ME4 TaxID=3138066 RepID=UPI00398BBAEB
MPWHLTPAENRFDILRDGLVPSIGPRSDLVSEALPLVHLFSRFEDLESAGWLDDAFKEGAALALFHVDVRAEEGAWTEVPDAIPAERVRLVCADFDAVSNYAPLRAMDGVASPFEDLEGFRATRTEMAASQFGELVGDGQWEADESRFLVYVAGYWIEALDDGRHHLTLENGSWITGQDGETLETLEERLFEFTRPSQDLTDAPSP